jgi:zinc transport system substrate-binding protein
MQQAETCITTHGRNGHATQNTGETPVPPRFRLALPMRILTLQSFFLLALIAGCNKPTPQSQPESSQPPVLSTVYPLADVVRQVGGPTTDLQWFCENGQDPRDLRLTDEQQRRVNNAHLIVTSGFRDLWAAAHLSSSEQTIRIIRPESTATGRAYPDDHGALWLDPRVVRELAEAIRERLTVFDAHREAELRASTDAFIKQLDTLDAEFRDRLAPFKGKKFLSLRPTWAPLADRYGLQEIAPLNTEPRKLTDDNVRTLKSAARAAETQILVIDASLLPSMQRGLQLRTGLTLLPLDPLGSSAPEGRSTWIKMMRYNLEQLEKGLK